MATPAANLKSANVKSLCRKKEQRFSVDNLMIGAQLANVSTRCCSHFYPEDEDQNISKLYTNHQVVHIFVLSFYS